MQKLVKLFTIIIFNCLILASCSFEDEIVIDPGNLVISNPNPVPYEISVRNADLNETEYIFVGNVEAYGKLQPELQKGYTYNISARELSLTDPHVIYENILVKAHSKVEWVLPVN